MRASGQEKVNQKVNQTGEENGDAGQKQAEHATNEGEYVNKVNQTGLWLTPENTCKTAENEKIVNQVNQKTTTLEDNISRVESIQKQVNLVNSLTIGDENPDEETPLSHDLQPGESATLSELNERRETRRLTEEETRLVQNLIGEGMEAGIARQEVLGEEA
jgi:hypothetical protein